MSEPASISTGIAARYATAVFDIAKESKGLKALETDIGAVGDMIADSADFRNLLTSPLYGRDEQSAAVAAIAKKIGFDAYGMTDEMPDPIARSINNLMDHMGAVDRKIDTMCQALHNLGDRTCDEALPELEKEDFVSLAEVEVDEASPATQGEAAAGTADK